MKILLIEDEPSLLTAMRHLRKKRLDAGSPDYITTRYGAGYMFVAGE